MFFRGRSMHRGICLFVILTGVVLGNCFTVQSAQAGEVVDLGGEIIDMVGDPIRDEVYATLDTDEVVRVTIGSHFVTARETLAGTAGPVAVSSDGSKLFVALRDSYSIAVFQLPGMSYQGMYVTSHTTWFQDLVAGSTRLYAASNGELSIIDTSTGAELFFGLFRFSNPVLRLSHDETTLFAVGRNATPTSLYVYDITSDDPVQVGEDCCHGCIGSFGQSMALSADEETLYLAAAGRDHVQVLNHQPTGLLNEKNQILLGQTPIALALAPDGTNLYVGFDDDKLAIANTANQLVYRVEPMQDLIKPDGIVVSHAGYELAIGITPASASDQIEFIDVSAPVANRGGIKLRPIDDIADIPVAGVTEGNLTSYGEDGFIDVQNGSFGRGPLEPGLYEIELLSPGYDTVTRSATVNPGLWADLGDITMNRTGDLAPPRWICAEPAVVGTEVTTLTIHGRSFHPDAVATLFPGYTIQSYTWQDWSSIEATLRRDVFSPDTGASNAINIMNPDGSDDYGYLFYMPGELAVLSFSEPTVTVAEGAGSIALEVFRTNSFGSTVSVYYDTVQGSASSGLDYTYTHGTLTWPNGDADPKTITVPIIQDSNPEGPESFTLRIRSPIGAELGVYDEVQITIEDDDSSVVRFADSGIELDESAGTASLTVHRGGDISEAASVDWATADGTATAGSDYTPGGGTLAWPAGDGGDRTIEVIVLDDSYPEENESFSVALSNPSPDLHIGEPSTAIVTITNDDLTEVSFASATFVESEGVGTATITAVRTGTFNGAISVDATSADGTAAAGSDYTPVTETLSWSDGDGAPKTFDVTIHDDTAVELDETVSLMLSNPTGGATIGPVDAAILTISDNDGTMLQFKTTSWPATENDGSVTIGVERIGSDTAGAVTVDFAVSDGTATAGQDFQATSGTLSWADGDAADKTFSVAILEDGTLEGPETVQLSLSNPTGNARLGSTSTALIVISDNDGIEVPINTTTNGPQTTPDVAMSSYGAAVVVWESYGQDGSGWGIYGQRFDPAGAPVGGEIAINGVTAGDQRSPAVAVAADGSFFVVWRGADDDGDGIRGRRFDATGAPSATEFTVNTMTAGDQDRPDIAIDGSGAAMVVWHSDAGGDLDVRGRIYDAAGVAVGTELALATTTADDQQLPAVAGSAAGGFAVAWQSYGQDGPAEGVIARRFSSTGAALTGERVANQWTAGSQIDPTVAHAGDGSFVVAWEDTVHQDGMGSSIRARRFDAAASPLTDDVQLNSYWYDDQAGPSIGGTAVGEVMSAWQSVDQDGSDLGVFAQALNDAGEPTGPELPINNHVLGAQYRPAVAASDLGTFWIVWASGAQDGSGDGIFGLFGNLPGSPRIFIDGFEVGDTSMWSAATP